MSEVFRLISDFLESGGLQVMVPLLLLAVIAGALVVAKARSFGLSPAEWLVPALARRRADERARYRKALADYLDTPSPAERDALLQRMEGAHPPVARLLSRILRGASHHGRPMEAVKVAAAGRLTCREIRSELEWLRSIGTAALFLGLLGAAGGLSRGFLAAGASGVVDASMWQDLIREALLAAQASFVVAALAIIGCLVLEGRARQLELEVTGVCLELRRAFASPWKEALP